MLLRRRLEALRRSRSADGASSPSKRCSSLPRKFSARREGAPQLQTRRAEASNTSAAASNSSPPTSTSAVAPPPPPPPPPPQHLPATYRRLVARVPSPSFRSGARVEELPLLSPDSLLGEGQVLVRVAVAGVNGGCETFRVRAEPGTPFAKEGSSPASPSSSSASLSSSSSSPSSSPDPLVVPLGAEGAGTVVAVGPGVRPSQLAVGDRVTVNGGAAFAEFVVAGARGCFRVPESSSSSCSPSLSPAAAVALSLSGLTAAVALHATAKVRRGETVLVTAAAGGTGHLAVQLAALAGCRVVAVAGGERKARRLRRELSRLDPANEAGHAVVDYKSEEASRDLSGAISGALASSSGGQGGRSEGGGGGRGGGGKGEGFAVGGGIDVCYEGVGGAVRNAVLRNLNAGARVLCVGYMGSYPHTENYRSRREGGGSGSGEEEGAGAAAAEAAPAPATETVFVSGPFDAEPRGRAALPLEPDLFWNRRVVSSLPGDRTIFGDVWSGAAGDPRVLARLRRDLFAAALRGEIVPWIDGEGEGEGEGGNEDDRRSDAPSFSGLEAASDAVERLLSGSSMGKVVLRVSEGGAW